MTLTLQYLFQPDIMGMCDWDLYGQGLWDLGKEGGGRYTGINTGSGQKWSAASLSYPTKCRPYIFKPNLMYHLIPRKLSLSLLIDVNEHHLKYLTECILFVVIILGDIISR